MSIRVISVVKGSPAFRAGVSAGDLVERINGEPVLDEIDYQALTAVSRLRLTVLDQNAEEHEFLIRKKDWEPLGLCLDETQLLKPRHCQNHCLFCFIDQLPRSMRDTLYVKDDDWRLSLMMGNYVTLTNVSDEEFERILRRRASPLYISVHATDPDVRKKMLRNPSAGLLLDRLRKLKAHGLKFHAQIVLCPGINDGTVLKQTVRDLESLYPALQSLAIVPVGLTAHRERLPVLKAFDKDSAAALIRQTDIWQHRFMTAFGTRLIFASDEFYCLSGIPIPEAEAYEDYPQIENGVGMLRQFEEGCAETYSVLNLPVPPARKILIPVGTSAAGFIRRMADLYAPESASVTVVPVHNRFFGETITVTGLIVGEDLIQTLLGVSCDEILISGTMLRESSDRFLDNTSLEQVQERLGHPVYVVENTGECFVRALWEPHI